MNQQTKMVTPVDIFNQYVLNIYFFNDCQYILRPTNEANKKNITIKVPISLIKSKLLSGREPAIWEMIWTNDPSTPLERQTIRRANN